MDPNPISENIISSNLESLHDKDDLVNLSGISLETLNEMLIEAVKNEDYESAVRIRDEISKR
jgi:protein-arginine kinase activator protein McsA